MPNNNICPWLVVFCSNIVQDNWMWITIKVMFQNTRIPCYKQVSALLVWRILIGAALSAARQCVMWHWERRRRSRKKTLLVSRVLVKGWESVGQSGRQIPFGCQSVIQGLCFSVSLMTHSERLVLVWAFLSLLQFIVSLPLCNLTLRAAAIMRKVWRIRWINLGILSSDDVDTLHWIR